jgi:hypothetical protein
MTRRWTAAGAVAGLAASVALMIVIGVLGPSAAVVRFPPQPPWPPWFLHVHPSIALISTLMWLAVLSGAAGLAAGLIAVRLGWRPRPRRLIAASAVAVIALMVIPPMGSADMLLYVAYGRIATLGHSPYVMTPAQLKSSGDPVGAVAVHAYRHDPSRYGPVATATEGAASELAGDSVASDIFWLKAWNGLAYLALVLALDRLVRCDAAGGVRAHLLWSVNPLMLWAVLAGGHNDGLAAGLGATALFVLHRVDSRRAALAGVLFGLAAAVKAPFALLGAGLVWAARRSPRALAALALGTAAVLVPGYELAGRPAISASMGVATLAPVAYTPWFAVARALDWPHAGVRIDTLGLIGFAVLGMILLWRMAPGPPDFPAVRVALAVALAWLIVTPQQHPWYFALVFPLLAVMPASRLDWIVIIDATAAAIAGVPRLFSPGLYPAWLSAIARLANAGTVPLVLTATGVALLWLCCTNDWRSERKGHYLRRDASAAIML